MPRILAEVAVGVNPIGMQKTERECLRGCRTIRVTMHPFGREGRVHGVEFWRDGEKCEGTHTPVCEPVEVAA